MFFAALFFLFAALFAGLGSALAPDAGGGSWLLALPFYWAALAETFTGFLYLWASVLGVNPGIMFKRPSGELIKYVRPLTFLYLYFEKRASMAYRRKGREPLFEEVVPGLYQGARPEKRDLPALDEAGITAVLDLVAEFEGEPELIGRPGMAYLCIPVLDGAAPTDKELEAGAHFVKAAMEAGRNVLVHCTFGHGRSSTFTAAALIASGHAPGAGTAIKTLKRLDRTIWLTRDQARVLESFSRKQRR